MKAFICEVTMGGSDWTGNLLTFATFEEADAYGYDLLSRWLSPRSHRVREIEGTPTHEWVEGQGLRRIDSAEAPRMPARRVQL
jgi:hypothetical protein